ncbi:Proteasome activator BLM10, partial [Coemansia guatemalensis]
MSHSTLKHLAEVEPDLIFRPLLDTLYTAIDSVTETHRMISAMRALAKLATTLSNFSHYPEGAQHVAPLLTLTLPGIDVNDPTKTYFALSFVCNLCNNGVVFEELLASGDMPVSRPLSKSSSSAMDVDQDMDAPPEVDMEQIEWVTRASTAQFETWIDQYLRRVFALMDNLSSSLDTNESFPPDTNLESMAAHTTERVLLQCSEKYHPMISRLMTDFATRITSLSAVGRMRSVVSAFALAMPEQALANLLPICCEKIVEEVENGVGLVPSLSRVSRSHSETTLIWFASILVVLTEGQNGTHLLPYKDQLISAVELLMCKCYSRQVYTIGCKLLHTTLMSLTRTTPLRGHNVSEELWNDPEFRENHFRYWGQHPDVGDPSFSIGWHISNEQEIEFAFELAHRIIEPRIGELDRLVDAAPHAHEPNNKENVYLNRLLVALCYSLLAIGCLIPPPGAPVQLDELSDDLINGEDANGMPPRYRLDRQVSAGYVFTDPTSARYKEVLRIRDAIGQVTAKTLSHMASNKEDNVENIKSIVVLAQTVICHHGVDRSAYNSFRRSWNYGLDGFSIDSSTSKMPRYIAIRRVRFTQLSRMFHNTRYMQVTELFRDITSQIARFCLSAYAEVRDYSISALDNIMAVIPAVKYPLIPLFLDELADNDTSDPEKMI